MEILVAKVNVWHGLRPQAVGSVVFGLRSPVKDCVCRLYTQQRWCSAATVKQIRRAEQNAHILSTDPGVKSSGWSSVQMPASPRIAFKKTLGDLPFHGLGFAVLKGWAREHCDEAHAAYQGVHTHPIFNSSAPNDVQRTQTHLQKTSQSRGKQGTYKSGGRTRQTPCARTAWLDAVLKKIKRESNGTGRAVGGVVLIRSDPPCAAQMAHCDYAPHADLLASTDSTIPHLLLIALEDSTSLDVWPRSHRLLRGAAEARKPLRALRVQLDRGDALLFRGDLVHAGSAYTNKTNIRVHIYLDTPCVKRIKDRTYIVSKNAAPEFAGMFAEQVPCAEDEKEGEEGGLKAVDEV